MKITPTLIEAGKSLRGGWTREQMALLGECWPVVRGWQERAVGREITPENAERFIALAGTAGRAKRRSPVATDLPYPPGFPAKDETVISSFHRYLSRVDRSVLRAALPVLGYMTAKATERAGSNPSGPQF